MKFIGTKLGILNISETIHVETLSGINRRCWQVLFDGAILAALTFVIAPETIKVTALDVQASHVSNGIGTELLLLLQEHYPEHWIEIPKRLSEQSFVQRISVDCKPNDRLDIALKVLKDFDDGMVEAEKMFAHMNSHQWGYNGRMEFYAKYPDFFHQEEARARLVSNVDGLPDQLVMVRRPQERLARSL